MDQVKCGKGIESLYNIIEGTYSRKCLINNQTLDINIVKIRIVRTAFNGRLLKPRRR